MNIELITIILGVYSLIIAALGAVAMSFIKSWMLNVSENLKAINTEMDLKADRNYVSEIKHNQEGHDRDLQRIVTKLELCKNCNA